MRRGKRERISRRDYDVDKKRKEGGGNRGPLGRNGPKGNTSLLLGSEFGV